MPATRPSTRIQRRTQSTPWSRRASSNAEGEPAPPMATAASSQLHRLQQLSRISQMQP